jgi:hypothetical protein
MTKRFLLVAVFLAFLSIAAKKPPDEDIQLTIINKSELEIAAQLQAESHECVNQRGSIEGNFYYLRVPAGDQENPAIKVFDIEKDTYRMQLFYLETYDPVYGFECGSTQPNALIAGHNLRLVVLPCNEQPGNVGEPGMRKYLPNPVSSKAFWDQYWLTRLIY